MTATNATVNSKLLNNSVNYAHVVRTLYNFEVSVLTSYEVMLLLVV